MAYSQSGSRGYLPMNSFPPATDCSGWATWVLRMGGINVPLSTTYTFMGQGRAIPISQRYLKLGDLVIYNGHVEVYVGNGRTVGHGSPGIHWHYWSYRPVIGVRRFFNV
jgi:cell wall-associated NlpC family hydrolase